MTHVCLVSIIYPRRAACNVSAIHSEVRLTSVTRGVVSVCVRGTQLV